MVKYCSQEEGVNLILITNFDHIPEEIDIQSCP